MLPNKKNHVDKPQSSWQPDNQPSGHSSQLYQSEPAAESSRLNPINLMPFGFHDGRSDQFYYFPIAAPEHQLLLQPPPIRYPHQFNNFQTFRQHDQIVDQPQGQQPLVHVYRKPEDYQSELDKAQALARQAEMDKNYMEARIGKQVENNNEQLERLKVSKCINRKKTKQNRKKLEQNAARLEELGNEVKKILEGLEKNKLEEEKKRKKNDALEQVKSTTAESKKQEQEQERVLKEKAQIKLAQKKAQLEKQVQQKAGLEEQKRQEEEKKQQKLKMEYKWSQSGSSYILNKDNPNLASPSSTTSKSETPPSTSNTIQKSKKKIKIQSYEKKAEPEKKEKPKAPSEIKLSITSPSSANSPSTSDIALSIPMYPKTGGTTFKKINSKQKKKVKIKASSPTTKTATSSAKNSGKTGQYLNILSRLVTFSKEDNSPSTSSAKMTKDSRKAREKALKRLKANQNSTPTTIQNSLIDSFFSECGSMLRRIPHPLEIFMATYLVCFKSDFIDIIYNLLNEGGLPEFSTIVFAKFIFYYKMLSTFFFNIYILYFR